MTNVYFIAGTLLKTSEKGTELQMASGVWPAESEEQVEDFFKTICAEEYPGFVVHETQAHCLDMEWVRETMPHLFKTKSGLIGVNGQPL